MELNIIDMLIYIFIGYSWGAILAQIVIFDIRLLIYFELLWKMLMDGGIEQSYEYFGIRIVCSIHGVVAGGGCSLM